MTLTTCPACGTPAAESELFCEACGAQLAQPGAPAAPAADPSQPHDGTLLDDLDAAATDMSHRATINIVDADVTEYISPCRQCWGKVNSHGACDHCGRLAPRRRDHWEDQPALWLAGVCDVGVRHPHNEDAMALAASATSDGVGAMVVCDGVTTAANSAPAALAAARAARNVLIHDFTPPRRDEAMVTTSTSATQSRAMHLADRIVAAGHAAQQEVSALYTGEQAEAGPPSCTFVAAMVETAGAHRAVAVTGWVGDSRAYWIPDAGMPLQLTEDDSWAGEAIAAGVPRVEAEQGPQAHAITRWLGYDSPDPVPQTSARLLEASGWLLVCSDGLWNYCSDAQDMAALVHNVSPSAQFNGTAPTAMALAEALTAWATEQGGQDNITVAAARIDL